MEKITLFENALDYVLDAVERLNVDELGVIDLKYSIVHLWSGIELLLKKRLMDEHWSLIFRDINKAQKKSLESGDFTSVYYDDAIKRLKDICDIDLSKYQPILKKIREDRNRLEHFQINLSKAAAISNLTGAWSFILDFITQNLSFDDEDVAKEHFEDVKKIMVSHAAFVEKRLKEIEPILEANEKEDYPFTVIDCPECMQDTLFLLGDESNCYFCNSHFSWEEAKEKWLEAHEGYRYFDPKEMLADPLIFECPECGMEGLYRFEDGSMYPPDPGWICFACGGKWAWNDITKCVRCEKPIIVLNAIDSSFCGECFPDD
jgi:hypothetical protein